MITQVEQAQQSRLDAISPATEVIGIAPQTKLADFADVIWPSDNFWGIPALVMERSADGLALPFDTWGDRYARRVRGAGQCGTMHFYANPDRYKALWKKPYQPLEQGCVALVEPTFDTGCKNSLSQRIWAIYKKRWLARYWQQKGLYIVADLSNSPDDDLDFNGVPAGWKAFSVDGRKLSVNQVIAQYDRAIDRFGKGITFVCFGGTQEHEAAARNFGWIFMGDRSRYKADEVVEEGMNSYQYESDNDYGVPLLNSALQASVLPQELHGWGTIARRGPENANLGFHFYVDDYRFNALWSDPWKFLQSGAAIAFEPNFSCDWQSPLAYQIWTIYKKRWLARYWQQKGIQTIVDLAAPIESSWINFLGVPKDWMIYACRGFTRSLDAIEHHYRAACAHTESEDIIFIVYGGGREVQSVAKAKGWLWVPEGADVARGRA